MAHNIARIKGTDQAWYADKPAWHALGQVTPGARTAAQVCKAIPLFRKPILLAPVAAKIGGKWVEIADKRATYRGGTDQPLGIVTSDFPTDLNDFAALQLLEAVLQMASTSRIKPGFTSAGLLGKGGTRGFASIELTRVFGDMLKVKRDPSRHESHVFATWGHDGESAYRAGPVNNRIDCQNMTNAGLAYGEREGVLARIIHAGDMQAAIREATKVMGFVEAAVKANTALMNALQDVPINKPKLWLPLFTEVVVPQVEDPANHERAARSRTEAREAISGLYMNSKTLVGVPMSGYRAYQAVAEYADHARPLRIGADVPVEVAADRRFRSLYEGPAAEMKSRALDWLRAEFITPAKA